MTRHAVISARQAEVLRELLRDGPDDRLIGRRLGVGVYTVRTHMKGLLAATRTSNRTALAVAVLRGDVVPAVKGRDHWSTDERRTA